MAYTKTIWTNDSGQPINATNLNKIEQGIYDASVNDGDMKKSIYDADNSGVVDNAEKVNNKTVETSVPSGAVFTDTTYSIGDGGLTEINFTSTLRTNYNNHISDSTIHFTMSAINITESQISDLQTYILITEKGAANGVAELDSSGLVPSGQLPSFVDDVLEYANFSSLPITGESGKIYVTLDNNLTYRWGGSAYIEVSSSLALGETSTTAYRGDRGKIAYDHSQLPHAPANAEANNISDTNATDLTDGGDSALHYHDADRDRTNHTGTQAASTISDFDIEVSNNTDVSSNTTERHTHSNKTILNGTTASYTTAEETKLDGIEDNAQKNDTNTALTNINNVFTVAQRGSINNLTYGANIDIDLALSNRYKLALTGDAIINLPTNIVAGQGGIIYIEQDAAGGRTLTWDSVFKFMDTPIEDTTANKINIYAYEVYDSTHIVISYLGAM